MTLTKSPADMRSTSPLEGYSSKPLQVPVRCQSARNVSFSKFPVPTKSSSDGGLQPTSKRRRYMRRGSKCPSMLLLLSARNHLSNSSHDATGSSPAMMDSNMPMNLSSPSLSSSPCKPMTTTPLGKPTVPVRLQPRRLSMMTALKLSLERISVVDHPTAPSDQLRSTPELRRKSTYELLSQI